MFGLQTKSSSDLVRHVRPLQPKYSDLLHIFQEGCIVLKALARPLLKGQQRHFVKIVDSPNHHKSIGYSVSFSHSEKSELQINRTI
jgi:hypothetical protein